MAETPDALARRWFKEVWDDGDESAIDRLMYQQIGWVANPVLPGQLR